MPLFKLYILNDNEVFFGYYPVQEHSVQLSGDQTPISDLRSKDTVLFQHTAGPNYESMASQYVARSRMWFDSIWNTVARDYQP